MKQKLKKIIMGLMCMVLVLIGGAKVAAMEENMYYMNPRFGFSIEYPDIFTEVRESDNGDGITLSNEKKGIELRVYGSNNVQDMTAELLYKEALQQLQKPIILLREEEGYLGVWEEGNNLVWAKVVVGPGSINGFQLIYPKLDQKQYEELVRILIDTFSTPYTKESR